jgi:hypothetical protein
MISPLRWTLCATALVALAACTDDEGPSGPGAPASVAFSELNVTVTLRGNVQLTPVFRDANGNLTGSGAVSWESSNDDVASVDAQGRVQGHTLGGPVTIRARAGSVEGAVSVTVVPAETRISPPISVLAVGVSIQLALSATDALGGVIPNGSVTWSSNDAAVASVDAQTGLLTAAGIGTAIITAVADGFTTTAGLYVGVPQTFDGLFLSTDTPNLNVTLTIFLGRVTQFSADYRPSPECRLEFGAMPFVEVPGLSQPFQFRLSNWAVNASATVVNDSVIVGGIPGFPATALSPGCLVHYGLSNVQNLESRNVGGPGFTIRRP